jgi:hypothetical protein
VFRNGVWYLNNQNDNSLPELVFPFGLSTDRPVVGDWDGDGNDTVGVFRNGVWHLNNQNDNSLPELIFTYGLSTDTPLVGNWDGN